MSFIGTWPLWDALRYNLKCHRCSILVIPSAAGESIEKNTTVRLLFFKLQLVILKNRGVTPFSPSKLRRAITFKNRAEMESTDGKCNSQMEISRSSEGPENEFPIGKPAFVYYPKTPYRLQECPDITKAKSHFVIFHRLVIPEKCQDSFIVYPG